jgi:hypothetical protein
LLAAKPLQTELLDGFGICERLRGGFDLTRQFGKSLV